MASTNTHNRVSEAAHHAAESSQQFVGEHAVPSTLTAFGLGFGAGMALIFLLHDHASKRHEEGVAHRLGRKMLDAMSHVVPDSLMKH